jgi:hypothetical protein
MVQIAVSVWVKKTSATADVLRTKLLYLINYFFAEHLVILSVIFRIKPTVFFVEMIQRGVLYPPFIAVYFSA